MKPLVLALAFLVLVGAAFAYVPTHTGCVMLLPDGQFNDQDCDRVPDIADNCPVVGNPEQSDVDSNGLGDLCDVVIDSLVLEPSEPMQGRSVLLRTSIFNNRPYPLRNLVLKAEIPRLGQTVSQPLPGIEPGQRLLEEIIIRVPECAPPIMTDFVAFVEYPVAPGKQEVFSHAVRVPVIPSGTCPLNPGDELTVVDIIELQDVLPERGAIYPFTIRNNWPESKAYILSVQGMESWGTATIYPGSVVVVPPGGAREGEIYVQAYKNMEGMKGFTFTVNARDDAKQVLLQADIKSDIPTVQPRQEMDQLIMGVVAFLIILILIGVVLALMNKQDKKKLHKKLEKIEKDETQPSKKRSKK